jgi:hypothetical protein
MINIHTGHIYNDNNVVNANDLRKRLINVDSSFKTCQTDPICDYQYKFEHTYKNIIKMRVASVEIPNSFYTFSSARQNNRLTVVTKDYNNDIQTLVVILEDGNYTSADLVLLIQNDFNAFRDSTGIYLSFDINQYSGKVTIINTGVADITLPPLPTSPTDNARPTVFSFATPSPLLKRYNGLGLAYNLGFRSVQFEPEPDTSGLLTIYSITGTAIIDVVEDKYLLLGVNDFHTLEHKTDKDYFQKLAKIIIREEKYAVIYDDGASLISNEIVFPQPQNLSTLQICLLDKYGYVIDLNGLNWAMTLEITEVMNTQLFQFYRNYIWFGSIPTIPPNSTNGAGNTLLNGQGPPV